MYLNISGNTIEDLSCLSSLPTLIELNAKKNNISSCLNFSPPLCTPSSPWSTGHTAVGSLLVNVDLSENLITEMGNDISTLHPFLEVLILSHNQICCINGLKSLQFLQVTLHSQFHSHFHSLFLSPSPTVASL
jgi:Leucine-rich repeat (LRR) protein